MEQQLKYHNLLRSRNIKGMIYRKYFLYPKLNRYIFGRSIDIGCGIGDFLRYSKDSIGVDINIHNIRYVNNLGLEAYIMENNKIPFSDKKFDSILLDNVLEHIDNPHFLLEEIRRIASENAVFIVGVPGLKGFKRDADHKVYYDEKSLKRKIQKYGFIHKETLFLPVNLKFLSKLITQFCLYQVFERDFSKD